jgi:hypothetical protein
MSKYEEGHVYFLESKDIDLNSMKLKPHVTQNLPVVVMVKSDNCFHCTQSAPAFNELAASNPEIAVRCIRAEDESGQEMVHKYVKSLYKEFRGFPTYLGFDKNGTFKKVHDGDRSSNALLKFSQTL